jgi:hypothetical protein
MAVEFQYGLEQLAQLHPTAACAVLQKTSKIAPLKSKTTNGRISHVLLFHKLSVQRQRLQAILPV